MDAGIGGESLDIGGTALWTAGVMGGEKQKPQLHLPGRTKAGSAGWADEHFGVESLLTEGSMDTTQWRAASGAVVHEGYEFRLCYRTFSRNGLRGTCGGKGRARPQRAHPKGGRLSLHISGVMSVAILPLDSSIAAMHHHLPVD